MVLDLFPLKKFNLIHEFVVSLDGKKLSTVVEDKDGQKFIWINGEIFDEPFEKVNFLQISSENKVLAAVQKDGLWTVFENGILWNKNFEYLWNLQTDIKGKTIAANVKNENFYTICVNGKAWNMGFYDTRDLFISKNGSLIATYVKIENYPVLDIFNFAKGMWSLAINDRVWEKNFLTVFGCTFSPDEKKVASAARMQDRSFTIVVEGIPWNKKFKQVWEPKFIDEKSVIAPVKTEFGWELYKDEEPLWGQAFYQLWNIEVHTKTGNIAAVVAINLGEWTVAVNGKLWKSRFNQLVLKPVFDPDGNKVATVFRHNNKWGIVLDDTPWKESFEKVGKPVFNQDGTILAIRGEKDRKYFLFINDKKVAGPYDYLWDPIFKNSDTIIVKALDNNKYILKEIKV